MIAPLRMLSVLAVSAGLLAGAAARAQSPEPEEAKRIEIDQKLGAAIPLDAEFFDDQGRPVTLRQYFDGRRPVVLTLNYLRCPMLCGVQLQSFLQTLKEMKGWTPGENFTILTVSFDPFEKSELARAKKAAYIAELGKPAAAAGWHFLTGPSDSIKPLTRSVGFNYFWNTSNGEWAHSAALILLTPDGRVSRYLGGLSYEPDTLRLSLVEASAGKVGTVWDKLFLWCFHYDSKVGRYTPIARNIMRLGAVVSMLALGTMVLGLWRYDARRRRRTMSTDPGATMGTS